jgi:hypothetical protein
VTGVYCEEYALFIISFGIERENTQLTISVLLDMKIGVYIQPR